MDSEKKKKSKKQRDESPPPKKRTRESSSSSDEGVVDRTPIKKDKKSGGSISGKRMTNKDGDEMIEIGSMRYVTVREFRGKSLIDIREYYMDKASGELRPGKKGISMTKEQYTNFKAIMPEIEGKL